MFLVGLTGGIATGKSTAASYFRELGCPVIDADQVAREVVRPGKKAWKKIRKEFGESFFYEDGELNREKLGQVIFHDEKKRKLLNSITHPEIYKVMLWQVVVSFFQGYTFLVLDLPLLFESGAAIPFLTEIIVVSCEKEVQLKRLMKRNNLNEAEAMQRISVQMPLEVKCKQATFLVDNSGTFEETHVQLQAAHHLLTKSRAYWKVRLLFSVCGITLACLSWKLYVMFTKY